MFIFYEHLRMSHPFWLEGWRPKIIVDLENSNETIISPQGPFSSCSGAFSHDLHLLRSQPNSEPRLFLSNMDEKSFKCLEKLKYLHYNSNNVLMRTTWCDWKLQNELCNCEYFPDFFLVTISEEAVLSEVWARARCVFFSPLSFSKLGQRKLLGAANDLINWLWWLMTYILLRVSLSFEREIDVPRSALTTPSLSSSLQSFPAASQVFLLSLAGPQGETLST